MSRTEYLSRPRYDRTDKADRVLELVEKGLSREVIAERLGITPTRIRNMLHRARQRRAKAWEAAE